MPVLDELWQEILKHTKYSNVVLTALWQELQKKKSDETPEDWVPKFVVIADPQTQQLAGHNPNRDRIIITNNGPGNIVLAPRFFDANEAGTLNTDLPDGLVAPLYLLSNGQTVTVPTHGAFYVYNVDHATKQAVVQVVEAVYTPGHSLRPGQHAHIGGVDSMLERGVPVDGDEIPRNRTIV